MITKDKLLKLLTYLLVFLIPSQLAYHFWPYFAFVYGIRVDYFSPAIYLTDLLLIILLFIQRKNIFNFISKNKKWLYILLIFSVINIFTSRSQEVSLLRWAAIYEFLLFTIFIRVNKSIVGFNQIAKTLFISAVVFGLIGIGQFITGKTLSPFFYFLGERTFNSSTPGIALMQINGRNFLRAYSTFPHPNALAGFLGIAVITSIGEGLYNKRYFLFCYLIVFLAFLITFSFSAFIGLFVAGLFYAISKSSHKNSLAIYYYLVVFLISLVLPVFAYKILPLAIMFGSKFSERVDMAYIAGDIISRNFLFGQGLGTYVLSVPTYKGLLSYSWILQPVHNIFLLVFSETGILGLTFLFVFFYKKLLKKNPTLVACFVFIVTTGFLDHYWITLHQNLLLLGLLVGIL